MQLPTSAARRNYMPGGKGGGKRGPGKPFRIYCPNPRCHGWIRSDRADAPAICIHCKSAFGVLASARPGKGQAEKLTNLPRRVQIQREKPTETEAKTEAKGSEDDIPDAIHEMLGKMLNLLAGATQPSLKQMCDDMRKLQEEQIKPMCKKKEVEEGLCTLSGQVLTMAQKQQTLRKKEEAT